MNNLLEDNSKQRRKYYKIQKPEQPVRIMHNLFCHQCKMKKTELLCCDNFFKKQKLGRCNGKYCDNCMQRHYNSTMEDFRYNAEWHCFKCTGECSCACCKRERGENVPIKRRKRKNFANIEHQQPLEYSNSLELSSSDSEKELKKKRIEFAASIHSLAALPIYQSVDEQRRASGFDILAEAASSVVSSGEHVDFQQSPSQSPPPSNFYNPSYSAPNQVYNYPSNHYPNPNCSAMEERSSPSSYRKHPCNKCEKLVSNLQTRVKMLKHELDSLRNVIQNNSPPLNNRFVQPIYSDPIPLPSLPLPHNGSAHHINYLLN